VILGLGSRSSKTTLLFKDARYLGLKRDAAADVVAYGEPLEERFATFLRLNPAGSQRLEAKEGRTALVTLRQVIEPENHRRRHLAHPSMTKNMTS
jgi:hypothetical protein